MNSQSGWAACELRPACPRELSAGPASLETVAHGARQPEQSGPAADPAVRSTMTAAPETESRGGRWRAPISAPREGAGRGYGRASRVNPRTRRGQPDLHRGSGLRSRLCAVFALRRSVYHRRREFVNYNNVKASDTCPDAPPAADLIPARHPSRRAGAGRPVPTGQTSHAAGPAPGPGRERNGSFGASWSGKLPFPPPEPFDRDRPT